MRRGPWSAMPTNARALLAGVGLLRGVGRVRSRKEYPEGLTGPVARICPGKRHAWIRTPYGERRKEYRP